MLEQGHGPSSCNNLPSHWETSFIYHCIFCQPKERYWKELLIQVSALTGDMGTTWLLMSFLFKDEEIIKCQTKIPKYVAKLEQKK